MGNAACCEPHGIGTTRLDHSASSAVDSRLSHGKRQQAAGTHRPGGYFCLETVPFRAAPHMRYLRELVMPHDAHKIVLEEYMQAIDTGVARVARLVDKMKQLLAGWEWEPAVRALMACKGFQEVAAMTVISELGDLRRFKHPRALMAFLGLVPGEQSSGAKRRQGAITKCGNSHCRWMLVECAQHFRKAPKIGSALTTRQEGQGKAVKELSWRMQNRLHKRYVRLKARGIKENKAIVAIARELSAFIWELQVKLNLPIPAAAPTGQ